MTPPADLSERELEILRSVWQHQQDSLGEPSWFAGVGVHMRSRDPQGTPEDVEEEIIDVLASLDKKGYVERVAETNDLARFPLYRVTSAGVQAAEER